MKIVQSKLPNFNKTDFYHTQRLFLMKV